MQPHPSNEKERPSQHELGKAPIAAPKPGGNRRAAWLYTIALILAFGPLAAGLLANVLDEYGLVSAAGTGELFRMAPMISLLTMPAAVVVMFVAVAAMFRGKR